MSKEKLQKKNMMLMVILIAHLETDTEIQLNEEKKIE